MAEIRKLQKTGNGTIIVSLPKEWVVESNLKPGDAVRMYDVDKYTLIIKAKSDDSRSTSTISFNRAIEWTIRDIISKYIQGYETIVVRNVGSWKRGKKIREIVSRILPGVDIVERENDLVIKVVIDIDKLNLEEIIKRNVSTLIWMIKSVADALTNKDYALLREVENRDDEIDRMTLLGSRQIHERVSGKRVVVSNAHSFLYYKSILEKLESIGDSVQVISTNAMVFIESGVRVKPMVITRACDTLTALLEKIPDALMNKDVETGNYLIDESKRYIKEILSKMRVEGIFVGNETQEIVEASALMVENLGRVAQVCREIGELIIDFSSQ